MAAKKSSNHLLKYIDRFPQARVLVVGDVMLDHYIWGKVSRISPEAPVPVVEVTRENLLLGAAANVVNNIHSLGGAVSICGVIGKDDAGDRLLSMLETKGVKTDGLLVDSSRRTTIKTRIIAHNQQVVRFDRETKDGVGRTIHQRILAYVRNKVQNGLDAIILSDYCKGVVTREVVRDIVTIARRKGIIVAVDPKVSHFGIYSGVTILTPNTMEAARGSRIDIEDDESLKKAGTVLLKRLKCDAVLITRGEHGMSLFEKNGRITHIPTVAQDVYDVTGAGDTVIGTLTLAMAAGARAEEAARISNAAAGIVVGVVGTATVTPNELKRKIAVD